MLHGSSYQSLWCNTLHKIGASSGQKPARAGLSLIMPGSTYSQRRPASNAAVGFPSPRASPPFRLMINPVTLEAKRKGDVHVTGRPRGFFDPCQPSKCRPPSCSVFASWNTAVKRRECYLESKQRRNSSGLFKTQTNNSHLLSLPGTRFSEPYGGAPATTKSTRTVSSSRISKRI